MSFTPTAPPSRPPAASTVAATPPAQPPRRNLVIISIVKLRWVFLAMVVILNLAAWNGQWRMGRDSALYRAVAQNLATGNGYTFRGEPERHAFPGLPLLLAGIDKIVPQDILRPTLANAVILLMGLLTLPMVYRLVRLHFPQWIAVAVTCGVAVNETFLSHSHDLLTDVPFFFGVTAAILGYEELIQASVRRADPQSKSSSRRGHIAYAIALMLVGLVVAATMRPTFYVLGIAWGVAAVWGLYRPERLTHTPRGAADPRTLVSAPRWPHAVALGFLLLLASIFLFISIRTRGSVWGRYEEVAADKLNDLDDVTWPQRLVRLFDEHVPDLFFGTELIPVFNSIIAIIVLATTVRLFRFRRLWGIYAVGTIALMLLIANKPRYFLPLLPFMLVGWALLVEDVSKRFRRRFVPEMVLWLGLAIVWVPNTIRSLAIIAEQHGIAAEGVKPFVVTFRNGEIERMVAISRVIAERVEPEQKVLGPEPRIMSYLSGRRVYGTDEFVRERKKEPAQQQIRDFGFFWGVFPAEIYKESDPLAYRLLERGFLAEGRTRRRFEGGGMNLAPLVVHQSAAEMREWERREAQRRAAQRRQNRAPEPDLILTPPPTSQPAK